MLDLRPCVRVRETGEELLGDAIASDKFSIAREIGAGVREIGFIAHKHHLCLLQNSFDIPKRYQSIPVRSASRAPKENHLCGNT